MSADMLVARLVKTTIALLACACFAAAAQEPPTESKAPQKDAETEPAAEAVVEFQPPPGFRVKKHGDATLYCRRETVLGSRFKAEKCYDQAGVEEIMRAEHESKGLVDKIRN